MPCLIMLPNPLPRKAFRVFFGLFRLSGSAAVSLPVFLFLGRCQGKIVPAHFLFSGKNFLYVRPIPKSLLPLSRAANASSCSVIPLISAIFCAI